MNPVINLVEFENRAISAIYRNLMIKAKVVVVEKTSGAELSDPVATIVSPHRRIAADAADARQAGS